MNYKLRSSVSIVDSGGNVLEFFKTNTRKSIKIHVKSPMIKNIVTHLDGNLSFNEIVQCYNLQGEEQQLAILLSYLKEKSIISNDALVKDREDYFKYRRIIHFLEDYAHSDELLLEMWKNIRKSTVMIIGLGAVGNWVALNLAQSGVSNFILMDKDIVDITNLHRQIAFTAADIGKSKSTVIARYINHFDPSIHVLEIKQDLTENNLCAVVGEKNVDLIINCADKPNVDITSRWVGKYCMKRRIPHIVGGGYNLHLSLIGQTVIPFESACVNCFEEQLKEKNSLDGLTVKRLDTKNRKIGSFGPMCSIIASMIGMEAIKVLSSHIPPDNVNRRGEFDINTMNLKYQEFNRLSTCEWCGYEKN
ncbi:HesA/MoeB/ThiF family protein [Sporolactobacillus spathodeae]|uniref:Molybdopterin/thiamine biosynthesis adenylyltransferase n=1 Tax=Sporolactobacillus spathodeae TaxID=1465502 RepID=A0ABS2Q6N2_9BACL|nr:ThiF family adenylyltransferase [Sporolactobacillus spathodeae]MBM7657236.1 molybdopterin/thiamine biosynthesis adenylyltransferase [Sporolactobacillus spathodeae]